MTGTLWLRDLGSFSLQLAAIIAAGAAVWHLLRVRHARITLAYWRVLLLAGLLLPAAQPWRTSTILRATAVRTAMAETAASDVAERGPRTEPLREWPLDSIVLLVVVSGVAARALWLLTGAWNLRRLRLAAVRLEPVPLIVREAEARIGARADLYVSDRIAGPITFGVITPIVMVPPAVIAMDAPLQEAIASHELLHVRRRDWLSVIGEEVIRTLLWFHPGVWWLIGRIQLSREHVVDEAVIRLTHSRDRYVEALIAVARTSAPIALTPAPLFLKRRFLKKRVAQILQETTMTTGRLIASVTASTGVLALAAVLSVRAFPLEAQTESRNLLAQAQGQAPVQIVRGGEHLLHGPMPEYPRRAIADRIEGEVALTLTVDDRGEISDARVVSGPDELRRASLASVLQWHYGPDVRSTAVDVGLQFTVANIAKQDTRGWAVESDELTAGQRTERQIDELQKALIESRDNGQREAIKKALEERTVQLEMLRAKMRDVEEPRVAVDGSRQLTRIRTERVPQEVVSQIRERAGFSLGDPMTETMVRRIREAAQMVDEHVTVRLEGDGKGGLVLVLLAP